MPRWLAILIAAIAGIVAGYGLSILAYIAYSYSPGFFDREGATAMGVAFVIGPTVAITCGMLASIIVARRYRRD